MQPTPLPLRRPSSAPATATAAGDGGLSRYRALIDSGAADSKTVAQWITETEARRAIPAAQLRTRKPRVLSREKIAEFVDAAGDAADALRSAPGRQMNRLWRALGLRMTYQLQQHKMLAGIAPSQHFVGEKCPRGDLNPHAR
ncbi:hypothetical protein PV410_44250 [Streptomyces sp. PA03-5A]|nr:hypothetical protein [Streptomyces sp. PA03-5A]